jgi:oxygen-independent coproporphyrinogen-3 oxidase
MTDRLPPLSVYIHLPWCVRKCPYCDFNSHSLGDGTYFERYTRAVVADIEREAELASGRPICSIFLGGGTPSLFSPKQVASILGACDAHLSLAPDCEITMEANPGTVESGAPAGYRRVGINRLSIGAQSFSADSLAALGRIHSPDDIERTVTEARAGGFENLNLDVMHDLPGQDAAGALDDLDRAIALEPDHISWYELTLEPNTVFHARPPANLPEDDERAEIETRGRERLEAAGFERYEVSAFAKAGKRCRHNLNYWRFGDYLGVGAGAHGKLTTQAGIVRSIRPANPLAYLDFAEQGADLPDSPPLDEETRLFEYLLNALRLDEGFEEAEFAARAGIDAERLAERARPAIEKGLIARSESGWWVPTALGRRFLNDLQSGFLP